MARPSKGQVLTLERERGVVYAIRYHAGKYGRQYQTVGGAAAGMTEALAKEKLRMELARVELGLWRPEPEPLESASSDPTFWEFSSEWYASKERQGLAPRTLEDYRWSLSSHLLPWFGDFRLSAITKREVDRFRDHKVAEGTLSPRIVNKVLGRLAMVLGQAVEYDLVGTNAAAGQRRRLKVRATERTWVRPQQLMSLLEASESYLSNRGRPLVAVMAATGLRIEEILELRWCDLDIPRGTLAVRAGKTDAACRAVRLRPALRDELVLYRDKAEFTADSDYVFPTATGRRDNRNNVRRRLLVAAAEKANVRLVKFGIEPIGTISPHSLRRTNATLRSLVGEPPKRAAKEMGHVSSRFTFDVYEQAADLREWLKGRELREFDRAVEWAQWAGLGTAIGTIEPLTVEAFSQEETENAA